MKTNTSKIPAQSHRKYIALAVDDNMGLESTVCPVFESCQYFVIIEAEGDHIILVDQILNPYHQTCCQPGLVPGLIRDQGVDVIIAGDLGRQSIAFFQKCGIDTGYGMIGNVRIVAETYIQGVHHQHTLSNDNE